MKVKRFNNVAPLVSALVIFSMPMQAHATSTGSAVRDILMDPRFEGAMSRITWLTEMVDNWFIQIITVTAFFIISMALLKNVLAAAYCAYPKIFDAIHTAHEEMAWSEISIGGMRELGGKIRDKSITKVILSIIPDVKAFTDFVDQDQTPKSYFMKAIPQMCIMVIMGIFIYNGYYRDVSATVGEAGATIVENVLGSVSPEKAVNDIFNLKSDPKNTYRNDKTLEGGYILDLSKAAYREVKNYSTVYKQSSEGKENLMRSCEYVAYNIVKGVTLPENDETGGAVFKGTDQYDLKLSNVQVTISTTRTGGYCTTDTSNGTRAFRYELDSSAFAGGNMSESEENLKGKIVVITGNLTPVAKSNKTFETTIEAIDGSQSQINAGFTTVTLSGAASQFGVWNADKSGRNAIYCEIPKLEGLLVEQLTAQLAANVEGSTLDSNSVRISGSESNRVVLYEGSNTNVCSVSFTYTVPSKDANGNVTGEQRKEGEANVTVNVGN